MGVKASLYVLPSVVRKTTVELWLLEEPAVDVIEAWLVKAKFAEEVADDVEIKELVVIASLIDVELEDEIVEINVVFR